MSSGTALSGRDDLFQFEGFTLDLRLGRLSGPLGDVPLRPKAFALLAFLARHAGRVLPKEQLLDAVWPDVTVTDESLSQCIHALRSALGEAGALLVKTVPRRGYLFDLPTGSGRSHAAIALPPATLDTVIPAARQGNIAVMPFEIARSIIPQDRLWFDGVVHDVISQLARLRSFDVISRGSTFALRHLAADPVLAGQTLGVAFVLSGSVVRRGNGFCLRVDLVRVESGAIVWTDEIDLNRTGILDLVGGLTDRIIASVLSEITTDERSRARLVPDRSLTAWQAYHRGLDAYVIYGEPTLLQARGYFELATRLDPGFVRAVAALSECQATLSRAPFWKDAKAEREASLRSAELAMRIDEAAPSAQFAYAGARLLHGETQVALHHANRSVALSPSFAEGHEEIGFIEAHQGDPENALRHLARSEALNPFSRFIDALHITRAIALVQMDNMDDAAFWAKAAVTGRESYPQMQATAAMVLGAAGHLTEACNIVRALRRQKAFYDPVRMFKPPFSLRGPAKERLERAITKIGL
jgi:TolB-like protein